MITYQIKTYPESVRFETRVYLGDNEFILFFDWNETVSAWYLSISDTDGNPVIGGQSIKIITNYPLNRKISKSLIPGWLLALDATETTLRVFYNV
jgi:hypothetical protein